MAVAFDATSISAEVTASPFSWNHTAAAGSIIVVGISIRDGAAPTVSGIKWNSAGTNESFTKLRADAVFRAACEIWYLQPSASGTHDIKVTMSANPADACGGAISFTGQDGTTPIDVATGHGATNSTGTSTHAVDSITTVTDNAWVFAAVTWQFTSTLTIDTGATQRWTKGFSVANGQSAGSHSTTAVSPAGAKSMGWTGTVAGNWAIGLAAIRPVSVGGSLRRNSSLNGLGGSGPFFHDPLASRHRQPGLHEFTRRNHIFIPAHLAKGESLEHA